jgi:TRAP-type mannitol/chloroaromatic compound transport system permease small subunit
VVAAALGGGHATDAAPLQRLFSHLTGALNAVGTVWIGGLMVLSVADVLGRDLFNAPVRGTTELLGLSIVGIVYLQLAHTLGSGRLTRSEALFEVIHARAPRVAAGLDMIFALCGAALMATLLVYAWSNLREAVEVGDYVGAQGDFTFPTWPVRALLCLGALCTAIQFALFAIAAARGVTQGRR